MRVRLAMAVLLGLIPAAVATAQEAGKAGGKGVLERLSTSNPNASEAVPFSPRFSLAYSETKAGQRSTWIVLTQKEPPVKAWAAARDREEARRLWCEKEQAPFVALKLDAEWKVDLYFLCPANGAVSTEMLNTWNGLDSVIVSFDTRSEKQLKGSLRTGQGSCPGPNGKQAYCTPTGSYTFDAIPFR